MLTIANIHTFWLLVNHETPWYIFCVVTTNLTCTLISHHDTGFQVFGLIYLWRMSLAHHHKKSIDRSNQWIKNSTPKPTPYKQSKARQRPKERSNSIAKQSKVPIQIRYHAPKKGLSPVNNGTKTVRSLSLTGSNNFCFINVQGSCVMKNFRIQDQYKQRALHQKNKNIVFQDQYKQTKPKHSIYPTAISDYGRGGVSLLIDIHDTWHTYGDYRLLKLKEIKDENNSPRL